MRVHAQFALQRLQGQHMQSALNWCHAAFILSSYISFAIDSATLSVFKPVSVTSIVSEQAHNVLFIINLSRRESNFNERLYGNVCG